ncbi:MAG: NAD-dependent epimerase/dehydratase family protein [Acidobacteriota bacterium]
MKALLTGATGFVGGHVLRLLVAAGAEVRCLVRSGSSTANLEGLDTESVEGDLRDAASVRKAVSGCEVIFHCAADYRLYARASRELYDTNVEGTRNVLRAAAETGVAKVVYTSSVGALGLHADGTPADEETPVGLADMVGHYKKSKYLAERVADQWADKGLHVVIVNPSTPIGERDAKPTATGKMIVDFLNRRVPAYVDTGLNLIDVRDVAEGHLLAVEKGRAGRKYILGHENLSLHEIYLALSKIADLPAPRVKVPHWLPLGYAAVETSVARISGREPRVPLEAVRLSRHKMYFDSSRAVKELGLPQSPITGALSRAVRWYHDNGYVEARG